MSSNLNTNIDPYERLIAEMPRIAEVVNAFTSESVQKSAYDALVSAIGAPVAPVLHTVDTSSQADQDPKPTPEESKGRRRRSGKAAKRTFSPTKGLVFAPVGKPTLANYITEKAPKTQSEFNLVACYYLSEMMGVEAVDVNHVLAVYREAGRKSPSDPINSLQVTASRTAWIDTENMSDIKVLWAGENRLDAMPVEKADAA